MRGELTSKPIFNTMHISTLSVHAGEANKVDGSAVFPIFQSATFRYDQASVQGNMEYGSVRYTRCNNNPSQVAVGAKLSALEGSEAALVAASGMAAISAVLHTLLQSGDHLLVQPCLYGGTYTLVHEMLPRMGITVTELPQDDPEAWHSLVKPNTKAVYVETISNPLCTVPNLPAVVALARAHGLVSVIDNTFASPANARPIAWGFDVVVESATKYLNGHSDVIAGVVAGTLSMVAKVTATLSHLGGSADPHACFLLQRGIKTLGLRVARQNANALVLAHALSTHPSVLRVHYPGLVSHPNHDVAAALFTAGAGNVDPDPLTLCAQNGELACKPVPPVSRPGYGGVFSFELHGGLKAAEAFMEALSLGMVAPSLGGVETLLTRPASTSHSGIDPELRAAMGITDGLIRVAVGIEDTQDLLADFLAAVAVAARGVA